MNRLRCNVAMLALLPILVIGCGGCAALDKGADPVVVRAEQFYQGADQMFRAFTTFEYNNRAKLIAAGFPEVEKAANTIRIDGFNALVSLQQAVIAYKANRTPENKANIATWIATAEKLETIASQYFSQVKL